MNFQLFSLDTLTAVVGGIIGILFGFDGWTGSGKNVDFRRSPRVKNLIYAIVGFFAVLISDINSLDATANRLHLLEVYVLSFAVAALLTVGMVAIWICVHAWISKRDPKVAYPPPPYSPVMDYVYRGYSYYQDHAEEAFAAAAEAKAKKDAEFITYYTDQTALSIVALDKYLPELPEEEKKEITGILLRNVVAVVSKYSEKTLRINANYMVVIPKASMTPADYAKVKFAETAKLNDYPFFLALKEYAVNSGREEFLLPVEAKTSGWEGRVLPGAPRAFLTNMPDVVDDTAKLKFGSGIPAGTTKDLRAYLAGKEFESFASMAIFSDGRTVGVLNVESNQPFIFGQGEAKEHVQDLLRPYVSLFGLVLK